MASSMALRRLASSILLRPRGGVTLSAALAPAATRSLINTTNHLALGSRHHYTTVTCFSSSSPRRGPTGDAKVQGNDFMEYKKPHGGGAGTTGELKVNEEGLHLKADMPGLGKEDIVVFIDEYDDTQYLVIMDKESYESWPKFLADNDQELTHTSYFGCIRLIQNWEKADGIKAEMKDGQLNITVPKLKLKDRDDLLFVKVV